MAKRGRPPMDPAVLEQALVLCRQGASPQTAAAALQARGIRIHWRTIHRVRAEEIRDAYGAGATAAPPVEAEDEAPAQPAAPAAAPVMPLTRQSLKAETLQQLCLAAGRLPFDQQDQVLSAMELARVKDEAIVRGLEHHPEAAAAVAAALRATEQDLARRTGGR